MDEYDFLHWRRSLEEREALIRDISWYCKKFYMFLMLCNFIYIQVLHSLFYYCLGQSVLSRPHCGYMIVTHVGPLLNLNILISFTH